MFSPEQQVTENAILLHHTLNSVTRIMTRQYRFEGVAVSSFGPRHYIEVQTTGKWRQRFFGSGGYVVRWRAEGRMRLALTFLPGSRRPVDLDPDDLTPDELADRMLQLGNVLLEIA